jgi:hypothetical protein
LNGTKTVQHWATARQVQSRVARRLYRECSIPIMIQKDVLEFLAFLAFSDEEMRVRFPPIEKVPLFDE